MSLLDGFNIPKEITDYKDGVANRLNKARQGALSPVDTTSNRMKEGVALTSPNDTSLKGTISAYKSSVVEQLDGIIGAMSNGLLNTKDITKAIRVGPDGATFSTDALLGSVAQDYGVRISGKSGAMRFLSSTVSSEFTRLTGLDLGGLVQSDGSTFRTNGNWRGELGTELLGVMEDEFGFQEFVDTSVKYSLYNSVLYGATRYGMSGSYESIYKAYNNKMAARDAFLEAFRIMIANGDITSMDAAIKVLDKEGRMAVISRYPEFIETLFSQFTFDDDVYPIDYPALKDRLMYVLNEILGPSWYLRHTAFGDALNLGVINRASKDMITLLSTEETLIPLLCCAGVFHEQSAVDTLKTYFPEAPKYDN